MSENIVKKLSFAGADKPTAICLPKSAGAAALQTGEFGKCCRCGDDVEFNEGHLVMRQECGYDARGICLPCAAIEDWPTARELYRLIYGAPANEAFSDRAALKLRGPVCKHENRIWIPLVMMRREGTPIGRFVIPTSYCQACQHQITLGKFETYMSGTGLGCDQTSVLAWIRNDHLAKQLGLWTESCEPMQLSRPRRG